MTLGLSAGALALALVSLQTPQTTVPIMSDDVQSLTLDVRSVDGKLEVQLIGLSPRAQAVSYALEVTGQSTSRHRGATTLTPGTRAVLSTMRTRAGENWCVTLTAEEEGRDPYEIKRGTCVPD